MDTPAHIGIDPDAARREADRAKLELDRLDLEVKKLSLEVHALRSPTHWDRLIGRYLPLATAFLAVAGFWFGVIQYLAQQRENDRQRIEALKQRGDDIRREVAKPFWDSQLRLYLKASEAAAVIATTDKEDERSRAEAEFWALYWGPLAAVEDVGIEKKATAEIEAAMVEFGEYTKQTRRDKQDKEKLERLSLQLAHAIRNAVGPAFNLEITALKNLRTK
jgi:hypothetical protein